MSGQCGRELSHQVRGVDALPVAERGQQPDAHVDGAVADREDPAVAGQRVPGAVAHVKRALDPWVVVHRALEVPADGHALRVGAITGRAERATEARVRAVGHDHVPGCDVLGAVVVVVADRGANHHAVAQQRGQGFGVASQHGAAPHGVLRHERVELGPPDHVAEVRIDGVVGPLHLDRAVVGDRPEPIDAVVAGEHVREAHVVELFDPTRRDAVTAGLLARERLALDEHHIETVLGRPVRGTRTGRPPADDEEIVHQPAAGARLVMSFSTSSSVSVRGKDAGRAGFSARVFSCSRSASVWPPKWIRS
ncbi:unannotated protein [freshwater metagenome]|uniref:Unannotated protein n=1 Tax=freshwater metagenome TaxID=449393 RepID=A0A6J7RF45_9ZZZZ